ncbi:MAG: hypothetical protein LBQ09_01035, partial [Acidobacteriaceae bacterium]|nr:hypothetical protein [Acidobacteriaceae bacterium]
MQPQLMALGLSSLGRLESRVFPTLNAVRSALAAMCGTHHGSCHAADDYFAGALRLEVRTRELFGPAKPGRQVALLVTCPTEAATDPSFMGNLVTRGVEAIRINCAHDGPDAWMRMLEHVHAAEADAGYHMQVFMDLAGPKIRTGNVKANHRVKRVFPGDRLAMVPPGEIDRPVPSDVAFTFECTLAEAVAQARTDQRIIIDDGKIIARISAIYNGTLIAVVERCNDEGVKLKPEKGVNFPDSDLEISALTSKDREDLAFIAAHANGVEFSFVQSADDVLLLQDALQQLRPDDWNSLWLVLKIETALAVRNLPEILVCAAARQPVAIMIARGDLAIEIGFARLAEMQEEILWIAEAAQVPVIWATQVLEQLVKEGMPNRGELTDAAMSARAECVMLNKGPYLLEAIDVLSHLLERMEDHMHKKTP